MELECEVERWGQICSSRKGICDIIGLPHRILKGVGPDGQCWSKVAEPYPAGMCIQVASEDRQVFED